jgi:hypothetical protein
MNPGAAFKTAQNRHAMQAHKSGDMGNEPHKGNYFSRANL